MSELDYLREACRYAVEHSEDPRTQNAAVLVSGKRVIYAANKRPPGVASDSARGEPPLKYRFIEHAERAVIYKAAASGVSTAGGTLYCPWFACADCARAIIMAGISEVVGLASVCSAAPDRWREELIHGFAMLSEAGVSQRWVAEELGVTITFDGRAIRC